MHVLFVHPNYPAQFRFIAPRLASDFGWHCTFATANDKNGDLPGVPKVVYRVRAGSAPGSHPCSRDFQNQVGHAYFA